MEEGGGGGGGNAYLASWSEIGACTKFKSAHKNLLDYSELSLSWECNGLYCSWLLCICSWMTFALFHSWHLWVSPLGHGPTRERSIQIRSPVIINSPLASTSSKRGNHSCSLICRAC